MGGLLPLLACGLPLEGTGPAGGGDFVDSDSPGLTAPLDGANGEPAQDGGDEADALDDASDPGDATIGDATVDGTDGAQSTDRDVRGDVAADADAARDAGAGDSAGGSDARGDAGDDAGGDSAADSESGTRQPPVFVQVNDAVPQLPQVAVSVAYVLPQAAGDLDVVVVGWSDSTTLVDSVVDTSGNAYTLAVGPTAAPGYPSQAIYYASNVAAALTNVVTVRFDAAAQFADVRVLEYAGVDTAQPLDGVAEATGVGVTSSTPAVAVTGPGVLVAANTVATLTAAAGPGFTLRVLTAPDGDLVEDQLVSTAGAYPASASLAAAGAWVMQAAAFRAR
ncbi:MAG TPA: hypothetical protein VE987_14095 [Polyangiaceae bacterium]|nr:hypothetical protein [Polyangiaceae bacterium]